MANFWQTKELAQMSTEEWELLCDGCAKCCLVKLEDHYSGEIFHTKVACELLDTESCQCSDYAGRHNVVDDCIKLDRENIQLLLQAHSRRAAIARMASFAYWLKRDNTQLWCVAARASDFRASCP